MTVMARRSSIPARSEAAAIDGPSKEEVLRQTELLTSEVIRLKELAQTFERWHEDMIALTGQSRDMHDKGEELENISRHLIMTSLNAAIEAARGGESARGFVVVAAEVRGLAFRARALSKDLGTDLDKTDLVTAATFQDIQAGGKMMMAAISGLESMVKQLRTQIDPVTT
jgi:methyl-accepting chemotaxis protein